MSPSHQSPSPLLSLNMNISQLHNQIACIFGILGVCALCRCLNHLQEKLALGKSSLVPSRKTQICLFTDWKNGSKITNSLRKYEIGQYYEKPKMPVDSKGDLLVLWEFGPFGKEFPQDSKGELLILQEFGTFGREFPQVSRKPVSPICKMMSSGKGCGRQVFLISCDIIL